MLALRMLLIVQLLVVMVATAFAVQSGGVDLVAPFLSAIRDGSWQGQFNVDFSCYLILSAVWVAWRHKCSAAGLALAALASVCGILFFAPYLLISSAQVGGDARALVLGPGRV